MWDVQTEQLPSPGVGRSERPRASVTLLKPAWHSPRTRARAPQPQQWLYKLTGRKGQGHKVPWRQWHVRPREGSSACTA